VADCEARHLCIIPSRATRFFFAVSGQKKITSKKSKKKFSYNQKIFALFFSTRPHPAGAGGNGTCAKISLFSLKWLF